MVRAVTENRTLCDFGGDDGGEGDEAVAGSPETDGAESDPSDGGATESSSEEAPHDPVEDGAAADFDDLAVDSDDPAAGSADPTADSDDGAAEGPTPATVTYAWSPEGDTCAECGETVDTRWRAGDGAADPDAMVCESCKRW